MKLQAIFESQARVAAGASSINLELEVSNSQPTREEILNCLARQSTSELANFLLDQEGSVRPSVLVFYEDTLLPPGCPISVTEGGQIVITSLISGG